MDTPKFSFQSELYNQYYDCLCIRAERYMNNPHDAADVVQNIFLDLLNKPHLIAHLSQFEAKKYLYIAVRNRCVNAIKRTIKTTSSNTASQKELPSTENICLEFEQNEVVKAIRREIHFLPTNYKNYILFRYVEGYSNHEVATMLGMKKNSLPMVHKRAKKKLQDRIRDLKIIYY